jgi:hypothetical protein
LLYGEDDLENEESFISAEAQFRVKAEMLVMDFRTATLTDYSKVKERLCSVGLCGR